MNLYDRLLKALTPAYSPKKEITADESLVLAGNNSVIELTSDKVTISSFRGLFDLQGHTFQINGKSFISVIDGDIMLYTDEGAISINQLIKKLK